MGQQRAIRDWNDIQYALAVAESGSFVAASERLSVHSTTVARRVQSLEQELGAKLFERRGHGMVPTAAGQALINKAAAMEDTANVIRHEIAGLDGQPSGIIRLAVPEGIGRFWLTPALGEFQRLYPEILVEVLVDASGTASGRREVDVAIALARPKDPRLITMRVGYAHYNLFAARPYLRLAGTPKSIEELREHKLVDLHLYRGEADLQWWNDLVRMVGRPAFVSDSSSLFLTAIQDGLGIGMAPSFVKFVVPDLMTLDIEPACRVGIWMTWREVDKGLRRVRVLIEFLQAQFARDRGRWFS